MARRFEPGDLVYYRINRGWEESGTGVNVLVTRELPATVVRQTEKRVVIRIGWRDEGYRPHRSVLADRLRGPWD